MVLYIHGFASSGLGTKAQLFKQHYQNKGVKCLAPSLSFIPDLAMQTLEEIIQNCDEVTLIGSSLGGYYALYLAHKYNLKAVLINPSISPQKTLKRMLGEVECFYSAGGRFCWEEQHLQMLQKFHISTPKKELFFLLAQKGDETLDFSEAVSYLEGAKMVVEEGGNHSFEKIERYFADIDQFLGIQ